MKKTVLIGVTGSIAAYKMADVASSLTKSGINVYVLMTQNATKFISPIVFSTLTGNKCYVDTFDEEGDIVVPHVNLAKMADLFIVAPASANCISKLANGIGDDMLTTTVLAYHGPKMISPAMNTNMYNNQIVQDNLARLRNYGWEIIEPASGILACKDEGKGKLPQVEQLLDNIYAYVRREKDLAGKSVLISAGPTQEALDPVRFISNHSSGKMGYALARNAMERGAKVTLISGNVNLNDVPFVETIKIKSASDLAKVAKLKAPEADIVIMAAAVGDYRPKAYSSQKIKKADGEIVLELEKTEDVLSYLGHHKRSGQFICGFSMETENLVANSRAKLEKKQADLIVANNLMDEGAGFKVDTNVVTLITKDETIACPIAAKEDVAEAILDFIAAKIK
ncbi:MAG: bifunctional phosphopantothenoylcysteine decarboxylase/phosphopantothenate--cysteine ligase CoaBC [Erysipelotrichaceae bacterium]|nr:bifunctional phosphopantothenoylcysteine decarboxylase/phosphopantothenate--cysteine ligase CoaBC [Erysipelotrichaceae bacterium]MDD3809574.1 bifunctional phosphopantothenoylcysteine decarboxylase/phosphopantothenate--cysteine ligase CoaBC [Erysipelotrichaceae bacterium]